MDTAYRSALLALLLLPSLAVAQPWGLEITVASHHICTGQETDCGSFREFNPGALLRYDINGDWVATAGAYLNSVDRLTTVAGVERIWHIAGHVSVGITAGLATGYRDYPVPAVLPRLHVGPVVLTAIPFPETDPSGERNGSWGVALGFSLVAF